MNNSYERLRVAARIVKKSYRRWKNKMSDDELNGYRLFLVLLDAVKDSERFLLKSRVLKDHSKINQARRDFSNLHRILKDLEFDVCAAFSAKALGAPGVDTFIHFVPNKRGFPVAHFFILSHKIFTASMTCSDFKTLMSNFFLNFSVVEFKEDDITLLHNFGDESDPDGRFDTYVSLAFFVLSVIFERPTIQGGRSYARISDCEYVIGPNSRYEAQNYYTYICEHSDAQDYRNSVREKRQAYGFTGTGGTKAFHYRQAHWRYYRELDKEVFVRGFFAGRHKPEVNVIR